jgi:murein DD-endopeptidase MepM/ murein hydrolase activator NlpD
MSALSPAQIAAHVRRAGFPEELVPKMTAIALAESSGNPRAHNPNAGTGDNSYGLFQVNMLGGMGPERRRQFGLSSNEELFDPGRNAAAARQIYGSQGLGAWSVYRSGAYKRFMDQAEQGARGSVGAATAPPSSPGGMPATAAGGGRTFDPGALAAQILSSFGSPSRASVAPALPTPQSVTRQAPRSIGDLAAGILDTSFAREAGATALPGRTRMAGSSELLGALGVAALAPFGRGREQVDALLKATLPRVGSDGFASTLSDLSSMFTPLGGEASGASPSPAAGGATSGPIRLGRISSPGEDPLPSTGPHLDVRIQKPDGTYINPATARSMLTNLRVGGKPLYSQQGGEWVPSFPVTSGYGPRTAPTAGASTYHRGLDFGVPAGTPIEWHGTPGRFSYAGGIGTLELPDGYRIKTLHTSS